ncbi:MAG: hypothetical protein U1E59_04545 [Amaricoccus sp.]
MPTVVRLFREADSDTLMREALGLAGLCVAILAAMLVPALA